MDDKQLVGLSAARKIQDGMTVGLGTGSTANCFIEALAQRCRSENLRVTAVASSPISAIQASALGLPLVSLEQLSKLDVYVDGADEVAPDLTLLKGRGQDLVREKILARAAGQFWVLADRSKLVTRVGEKFPTPIEVWPFAWQLVQSQLKAEGIDSKLRIKESGVALTSAGTFVLDAQFPPFWEAAAINRFLNDLPGVVEHGIFLNLASLVLIATDGQVEERRRSNDA
ncbi:MAG: ribose-5-phosphate isomerase RpiA [Methylohalobius sp.]|nr:ribose-5-phosphate isomerase RpiA [Methylohalobius sp.]